MVTEFTGLAIGGSIEGRRLTARSRFLHIPVINGEVEIYHFEGVNDVGFWRHSKLPLAAAVGMLVESYLIRSGKMKDNASEEIRIGREKLSVLRCMRDRNGEYLWMPAVARDQPETFMGIPVEIVEPKR